MYVSLVPLVATIDAAIIPGGRATPLHLEVLSMTAPSCVVAHGSGSCRSAAARGAANELQT